MWTPFESVEEYDRREWERAQQAKEWERNHKEVSMLSNINFKNALIALSAAIVLGCALYSNGYIRGFLLAAAIIGGVGAAMDYIVKKPS